MNKTNQMNQINPSRLFCSGILRECSPVVPHVRTIEVLACRHISSAACSGDSETVNQCPSVALTGLGVHVSMILYEFSNVCRWHLLLVRRRFTVLIITKEACA